MLDLVTVTKATKFEIKRNSFAELYQLAKFQTNQTKDSHVSMTSYPSENVAENVQNGDVHFA